MMCEKRFKLDIGDDYCFINDEIEDKTYAIYNDRVKERWAQEIVDLLNEQQNTINELDQENADCLGDQIRNLEEFEKCTNKLKEKILEQQATISTLKEENEELKQKDERLRQQIQNYEQLLVNSYVGEEETLDGFVGKYVIFEDELQKYKNKNEMIGDDNKRG